MNEIQGYKPTAKDLDYPGSLKRRTNGHTSQGQGLGLKSQDGSPVVRRMLGSSTCESTDRLRYVASRAFAVAV